MAVAPPKPSPTRKPPPAESRPSGAVRWGRWVARRRWWMLSAWAAIVVASGIAYPHLYSALVPPDYSATGSDSAQVSSLLSTDFTAAGGEQDVVVFDSSSLTIHDAAYIKTVNRVLAKVKRQAGVAVVLGPTDPGARGQVSKNGHAAVASVGLSGDDRERSDYATDLQDTVAAATATGPVRAYLTGYSPSANDITDVEAADVERAESIGLPVAFVVLLFGLGAVVAGFVPLITALISLMATFGVIAFIVLAMGFSADAFLLSIVTMIGVGVSIDYSLFIISRYREELARGRREARPDAVPHAVGLAMTTSGRTIAFSGILVVISLVSLCIVQSPLFREIAVGAVLVVACTLITAWTMLPALLAALGDRVNRWALPKRFQPAEDVETPEQARQSGWARWARTVLRHPWIAIPAAALLVLFALPTFGLKVGIDLGLAALSDKPSGKGQVILADSFSPGALSPVQILASHEGSGQLSAKDLATIDRFTKAVAKDPRVDSVFSISTLLRKTEGQVSPQALQALKKVPKAKTILDQTVNVSNGSDRTIITVVTKASPDSSEAEDVVNQIRDTTVPKYTGAAGPQMLVGGETAQFVDIGDESLGKLPWVFAIVLTLSFFYLLVIFRSLLIPAKAVVMNLLATAAAFGLTTWVFSDGHLENIFGFTSVGFVQVYLPIFVFALLFGLSMDYEVFLIRRIQEEWLKTHDNEDAIAAGIAHTARPIVAAAAIMAAVFGCYIVADVLELKEFGFSLAMAVILDATLVRLLLVPAIMKFAGPANWWLPKSLDRHLPRVRLD